MVTNPDGSSVTLAAGFTYKVATLELSKADVGAGEPLVVRCSGPPDPSDFASPDVIGVYAIDDPSNTALWWTTSGVGRPVLSGIQGAPIARRLRSSISHAQPVLAGEGGSRGPVTFIPNRLPLWHHFARKGRMMM